MTSTPPPRHAALSAHDDAPATCRIRRRRPSSSGAPRRAGVTIRVKRGVIRAAAPTRQKYLRHRHTTSTSASAPAGTGKTYLAVASAVDALERQPRAAAVILVRPAVEAGEKLGFLPGDLSQKVDPYLPAVRRAVRDFGAEGGR